MPRSLTAKLTLAFLLVALTVAVLVGVFIRLTSAGQLDRLIVEQRRSELRDTLAAYYAAQGTWAGVYDVLYSEDGGPPVESTPAAGYGNSDQGRRHPDNRRDRHDLFGLVDAQGIVVVPLLPQQPPGSQVSARTLAGGEPIKVNGQVVGTILTDPLPPGLTPEETAYLQRTNLALLLAGGGAVLVALLVGVLLARTLTRPLHALTQATQRMAGGALEQEVPVNSSDEIGELAAAFNQMSRALARANTARRQMTADVAHELRTPLTVIAGYIEAMRDGVLASTPDRLAVIYSEIEHLEHLVGDLRILSQADAGELKLSKQPVAPAELLQQASAAFEHQAAQKGVRLGLALKGEVPSVMVDETRMAQVLGNLLTNALRYTPAGGRVTLGAAAAGDCVNLTVQDTGPGIAPKDLPFIFDRLYRADKSRSDESGASGLGLAIVKAIVEAHGGAIAVHSAPGAGSTFAISLPRENGARP